MKRHEALAPLSREHHGSLILAQLLKKGAPAYKGLPEDNKGKARFALQQYEQVIRKHFKQEEQILKTVKGCHEEIRRLNSEIINEHEELTALFLLLDKTEAPEEIMDRLGRALESHIRKEERDLFPLLQQHCSEKVLQQIYESLHKKSPVMKKDITTRADIELLVNEFYAKVKKDPVIGFIFTDVAKVNWEKHMPVMYDFFENMLFYTGSYTGNPMELHKRINGLLPLTAAHFQQWEFLFNTTVDELFKGTTAGLVKQRAMSISKVMQLKILDTSSSLDKIF